jgi:hypothetical protein
VAHLETVEMSACELVSAVNDAIVDVLDGRELTRSELAAALAPKLPPAFKKWFDEDQLASFAAVLARAASLNGTFVLSYRHRGEAPFVRTDQWLGAFPDTTAWAIESARKEMVRRYLRAYGPSSPKAYAEWAGTGERVARLAFTSIAEELVPVSVDGAHGHLLAEDAALLGEAPEPAGVRFLPPHDPYLAAIDRRVIVPDTARHKKLWRGGGNPGAVLANGEIVASWRANAKGSRLELEVTPFRTLPAAIIRSVELQAPRLAAFNDAKIVRVVVR